MKVATAFVGFLAICAVQFVSGADISERETVKLATILNRNRRDAALDRQLDNAQINSIQGINDIVNRTLQAIETATTKSTAGGKNASHCYEAAKSSLRSSSQKGNSGLNSCRRSAKTYIYAIECNRGVVSIVNEEAISIQRVSNTCIAAL